MRLQDFNTELVLCLYGASILMVENGYSQTWYVYVYIDDEAIPFYVGKGTRGRMFAHEDEARTGCTCQKCKRIRSVWERGHAIIKHILFESFDEMEAFQCEEKWIQEYADTLVNIRKNQRKRTTNKDARSPISHQRFRASNLPTGTIHTIFNGMNVGKTSIMVQHVDDDGKVLVEYPINAYYDFWGPVA